MAGVFPIKIPSAKYKVARDYQKVFWERNNIMLPLWRCFLDTEMQQSSASVKQGNDPFKHLRRGFKL